MAKDGNTIVRVQKKQYNYVTIDKTFLADDRMSWRAKGVLAYLLAKPDNWQVYVSDLVKRSTEGRDSVYKVLNELIDCGYVVRNQLRNERGRLTGTEYIVYEQPIVKPESPPLPEKPDTVMPETDSPDTAEPTQINNDLSINDVNNKQQQAVVEYKKVTGRTADLSPLVDKHGYERVMTALQYMKRYKKKITNPMGFLVDALSLNWDMTIPPDANLKKLQDTYVYIDTLTNTPRPEPEQVRDIIARLKRQLE